ncbi:hypothetical protein CDCA_CDCA17G4323 [Cyanidium caldarium]|uniref:IPT/TIG domain-containing protein n=1 Tax=Cyanidium caldarium TaxID=2771 RepID=A0AAV9J1S4_CYACA|nr:hypothetical protein CDCA_CDCA17G4323 [Cyanidium caldarium]
MCSVSKGAAIACTTSACPFDSACAELRNAPQNERRETSAGGLGRERQSVGRASSVTSGSTHPSSLMPEVLAAAPPALLEVRVRPRVTPEAVARAWRQCGRGSVESVEWGRLFAEAQVSVRTTASVGELLTAVRRHYLQRAVSSLGVDADAVQALLERVALVYSGAVLSDRDAARSAFTAPVPSGAVVWLILPSAADAARPRVLRLEPCMGLTSGGSRVFIFGKRFQPVSRVRFGPVVLPANRHSSQCLECTAPPHEPGVVSVEVSCADSAATDAWTANQVTYQYVGYDQLSSILSLHVQARHSATTPTDAVAAQCRESVPLSWRRNDEPDGDGNRGA